MVRARSLRLTVAGMVMATLGCSSSPTAPDGWTMVELDGVRFAHPEAWAVEGDDADVAFWTYQAMDAPLESATVQLRATPRLGPESDAGIGTSRLIANYQLVLPGFRIDDTAEVEVAGASSAERTRFSYDADTGDRIDGLWLVAADEGEARAAALQVSGEDLDDELLDQLEASVELTEASDRAPSDGAASGAAGGHTALQ